VPRGFHKYFSEAGNDVLNEIKEKKELDDKLVEKIKKLVEDYQKMYASEHPAEDKKATKK